MNIVIEPLTDEHINKAQLFYCRYDYIKNYIRDCSKAYRDARTGETKTFVVIHEDSGQIAAYFSLKCSSLRVEEQNNDKTDIYVYPTVEVVMFAVHEALRHNGIGQRVFAHIINYIGKLRREIGIRGITLFSVPEAVSFYKDLFNFKIVSQDMGMDMYISSMCEKCTSMYLALPELTDEEIEEITEQ